MALFSSFGETNLDALSKEITDNAVDIFVYDTRKDSDGGKWRKRTKKTSWYNETLNTATRGSRREFPAVAVIVAEATQVTIYDGDDPDLPMWMVINRPSITISSVFALNGNLIIGMSNNAMDDIRFISDLYAYRYTDYLKVGYGAIVNRGGVGTFTATQLTSSGTGIVNAAVNDVAMTVLPNAPIDPSTGLPVPTIAVGTDGGMSVIRDDGTVVDITASNIYKLTTNVLFDGEKIIWGWDGYSNLQRFIHVFNKIPSSDVNFSNGEYKGSADAFYGNTTLADMHIFGDEDSITKIVKYDIGLNDNPNFSVQNHGIIRIHPNYNSPSDGIFANITKDFNTGWMHGDIKGAFLSDTDATNVTGTELVTNGTFDTDTSNWTAFNGASLSVSSNELLISYTSTNSAGAYQDITVESGKIYVWTYNARSSDALQIIKPTLTSTDGTTIFDTGTTSITNGVLNTNDGITIEVRSSSNHSTNQVYSTTFKVTKNGSIRVRLIANYTANAYFDNVSVRIAEDDRSVNSNGLQVFGTITKSPVATGADLVAYSGNGTSNYLERPYDTDLNFGTGDFSIMGWINTQYVGGGQYIFNRSTNTTLREFELWVAADLGYISMWLNTAVLYSPNGVIPNLTWTHFCAFRKSGYAEIYINGRSVVGGTSTMTVDTTNPAKILYNCSPTTKFSLLRVSGTAPSPEQIKKIYEDEKVLFQENAACTLYGSSDAVTALAYDDKTNLLHVGTSSGRSDFRGLRRINNTTTGITTAISASNKLIAEQ